MIRKIISTILLYATIFSPLPAPAQTNIKANTVTAKRVNGIRWANDFCTNGVHDQTCVANALTDLGGSPGAVYVTDILDGSVWTAGVTVSHVGQYILCPGGKRATTITFSPASAAVAVTFSAGASVLYQTGIQGCRFSGTGVAKKTAIKLSDVSESIVKDIAVIGFTGSTSIGIQTNGRELSQFENLSISADRPIDIQPNPNSAIMLDAFRFKDVYALPQVSTEACINVNADGTNKNVQHWRIDGLDCVGGKYVLYDNDSGNAFQALDWDFRNIHWEQQADITGYAIYSKQVVAQVVLTQVDAGLGANGFYLRNVIGLSIINSTFQDTTRVCIDEDATDLHTNWNNFFCQTGSTVNLGGQNLIMRGSNYASANYRDAIYESTSAVGYNVFGTGTISAAGGITATGTVKSTTQIEVGGDGASGDVTGIAGNATATGYFKFHSLTGGDVATIGGNETSLAFNSLNGNPLFFSGAPIDTAGGITSISNYISTTANSASWTRGSISELITLSTVGTTTDSATNLLPANSIIEAVVARVTTTITTATDWKLGDATIAGRFSGANAVMTAGTTQVGTVQADQTGTSGPRQVSAAKLRITTTGTPGAGVIRVTTFYRSFTAPGS